TLSNGSRLVLRDSLLSGLRIYGGSTASLAGVQVDGGAEFAVVVGGGFLEVERSRIIGGAQSEDLGPRALTVTSSHVRLTETRVESGQRAAFAAYESTLSLRDVEIRNVGETHAPVLGIEDSDTFAQRLSVSKVRGDALVAAGGTLT